MRILGLVVLLASLCCPREALAETGDVMLKVTSNLQFDCERPFMVRNHPIRAVFNGVLRADRSVTADLAITGVIMTNTVRFETRLGSSSQPAPGGTTTLRVVSRNHVRAMWDLPNNQLTLNLTAAGPSCSAAVSLRLKPGHREYSLFDGKQMYYCSQYRLLQTTCEAQLK